MKQRERIIAVTGLTGVGKDFVGTRIAARTGIALVNWGTVLGQILEQDRDEMMTLTHPHEIARRQFEVCDLIRSIAPVIVTCHTVRSSASGVEYSVPLERRLNPAAYIFVTSDPKIIRDRVLSRNATGARSSPVLDVDELDALQRKKRVLVADIAAAIGAEYLEFPNDTPDYFDRNIAYFSRLVTAVFDARRLTD